MYEQDNYTSNYISKSHKHQFGNVKHSWTRASPQGGAGDGTVRAIDGGYDGDLEGTK